MLGFFDQSAFVQDLGRDLVAGVEIGFDLRKADLDPLFLKDVRESAFRQTTLERHLSALKPGTAAVTRA